MSEEAEDGLEGEISVVAVYFFAGLFVPLFFDVFTLAQDVEVYFAVLGIFAACVIYGELSVSIPTGFALGAGMLLASFAGQNWWFLALAVSSVALNLAKNGLSERGVDSLDDLEFGPSSNPG